MSTLRISDAPLLPDVNGTEKIPTGGRGDYAISVDQIKDHIFQDVGKELVGLGNVDNTSDLDKPVSTAQQAALDLKADKTYVDANLDLKADKTNVYTRSETTLALSQKADLVNGTVPSNQLPSYVDDVVEYTTSTLPIVGESGKIYITTDTNRTWRWSGNQYVEISNGGISDSTLKLQTPRKIANVDFDGTQNIEIPHNNLKDRDVVGAHSASAILDAGGKSQQEINYLSLIRFDSLVSVTDYGASPSNTAEDNDIALAAAIDDLNTKYTGLDGFLRVSPPKCALMIPSNGEYKFSGNFHITGNYSLLMYGICKHEGTVENTPFIKIGRQVEYDSLADNEYLLNAYTTNANTYGFELLNMVSSYIQTRKIKGFKEGLRCIARGGRGFFGNTVRIGTFDSNIIDIHIRAETSGAPNANRFYDGFFYKQRNMTVEQNCVKISSDGTYNDIDSNLFDGLNFEEGKATVGGAVDCIPINLEVGVHNRFINIRTENNSNTALARVNKRGNTIQVRAAFTTSTEIISSTVQQTLVVPQDEMQCVYSSGNLTKESIKLATSGRVWNPNITFNDANIINQNSTISTSALQLFDLTNAGIKFLNQRSMLSFKVKTNGDRRFLLRTFAEDSAKRLNTAIACYDAAGVRLSNDPAIAIGTWGVQQRIKSNDNVPLGYSATTPWSGSGAYLTPITNFQTRLPFEVHPSVAMIEVYYFWAGAASDNDITLSHFELYSIEGNASVMDAASPNPTTGDRWLYQPVRGALVFNLSASSAFDPPSLTASGTAGSSVVQNISAPGAAFGDIVGAAFNQDLQSVVLDAWVSSAGVVSVKFTNTGTTPIDLVSGVTSVLLRRLVT